MSIVVLLCCSAVGERTGNGGVVVTGQPISCSILSPICFKVGNVQRILQMSGNLSLSCLMAFSTSLSTSAFF